MKMMCKGQHWEIKDKQLILDTPEGQEAVLRMMAALEARLRLELYEEICSMKFGDNRKAIVKAGIENVALTVQSLIAEKILAK